MSEIRKYYCVCPDGEVGPVWLVEDEDGDWRGWFPDIEAEGFLEPDEIDDFVRRGILALTPDGVTTSSREDLRRKLRHAREMVRSLEDALDKLDGESSS